MEKTIHFGGSVCWFSGAVNVNGSIGLLEFPGFSKIVELESDFSRCEFDCNGKMELFKPTTSNISIVFTEFYPFEVSAPPQKTNILNPNSWRFASDDFLLHFRGISGSNP